MIDKGLRFIQREAQVSRSKSAEARKIEIPFFSYQGTGLAPEIRDLIGTKYLNHIFYIVIILL